MKISTRARYGLRLMVELGLHYGKGPVLLKDIAKNQGISEKYLSLLVIPLKTAGFINATRGMRGGYALSMPPKNIKLKKLVEVLEGDLNVIDCIEHPSVCKRIPGCVTRDVWRTMGDKIKEYLNSITLEDLVKKCKAKTKIGDMYHI